MQSTATVQEAESHTDRPSPAITALVVLALAAVAALLLLATLAAV